MKRLRHWLFNVITVISLLLFIATLLLWRRSVSRYDSIIQSEVSSDIELISVRGHFALGVDFFADPLDTPKSLTFGSYPLQPGDQSDLEWSISDSTNASTWNAGFLGFYVSKETITHDVQWRYVVLTWFIAAVSLAFPLAWIIRRHRQRKRRQSPLCPTCGYDLRATPDRCPECGAIPPAQV